MFINILLGHLVGDYLVQNDWMAKNKSKYNLNGWLAATVHCLVYSLAVLIFTGIYDWIWYLAIFLTHFPIDKFGLAEIYLKYVKGLNVKGFLKEEKEIDRMTMIQASFITIVYTVTDNTIHLLLMWGAYNLLY